MIILFFFVFFFILPGASDRFRAMTFPITFQSSLSLASAFQFRTCRKSTASFQKAASHLPLTSPPYFLGDIKIMHPCYVANPLATPSGYVSLLQVMLLCQCVVVISAANFGIRIDLQFCAQHTPPLLQICGHNLQDSQ